MMHTAYFIRGVFVLATVVTILALAACSGAKSLPDKPRTLEADISFSEDGNAVILINKNQNAWHKLYLTFIDDHRYRFHYIDENLTLRPGESVRVPLSHFRDEFDEPMNRTRNDWWQFRIEDGTRIWRLQRATAFPTS